MLAGPVQVPQLVWHASHVFVPVLGYFAVGQVKIQVVPSRYLVPVQVRQLVFASPEHVKQSVWQLSHVFVPVLGVLPAGHVAPQLVPSR